MTRVTTDFVFSWPFLRFHVCSHRKEAGHSNGLLLKVAPRSCPCHGSVLTQTQSPSKPQLVARVSAHCKQTSTAQFQKPQPPEWLTPAPSTVADTVLLDQKIATEDNLSFQAPDVG